MRTFFVINIFCQTGIMSIHKIFFFFKNLTNFDPTLKKLHNRTDATIALLS